MKFDKCMSDHSWAPLASVLKRNSVELGYYKDEYIKYFSPKTPQHPFASFFYYMRVVGNRKIFLKFFECFKNQRIQFVNLGSGLDTTSFWILDNFKNAVCYDLDLENLVKIKLNFIKNTDELLNLFPGHQISDSSFHSDKYHIFSCDLRNVNELDKLKDYGFSSELPTIYLSEYVLTYIKNEFANQVIGRLSSLTSGPSILVYQEYIKPNTPYSKWLYSISLGHNTPMYSFEVYSTDESQIERYKSLGWDYTYIIYYNSVYNYMIDKDERKRLRNLEHFNDMKSLGIICNHAIIGVSVKNCGNIFDFLNVADSEDDLDNFLPEFSDEYLENEYELDVFKNYADYVSKMTCVPCSEQSQEFFDKFK